MKRIVFAALAACFLFLCACAPSAQKAETFAMDTIITQTVYADNDSVLKENEQILRDIENKMSKTIETSDVARLNAGGRAELSAETAEVLKTSLEAAHETNGAFSPALGGVMAAWGFGTEHTRVPSADELEALLLTADYQNMALNGTTADAGGASVDLGGAVKGYALDRLALNLSQSGVSSAIISLGGSIYATGKKPDGGSYKIGIRDPEGSENDYMAVLSLDTKFVSTSGTYERGFIENGKYYHHIIDPKTGAPVENGLAAVTVVCDSGILSDIYSTALFVMGPEAGIPFAQSHGVDALFLTQEKQVLTTHGFAEKYALEIKNEAYTLI